MIGYRKTVKDIDVKGKYVFLRASLDVPLDPAKDLLDPERVTDDTRIKDIMPTLYYLIDEGAKIILAAGWCGRPKGEDADFSMAPVAKRIEQLLENVGKMKHEVLIAPNCYIDKKPRSAYKNQEEVKGIINGLKEGQVAVMENVRYDPEANANDEGFAEFMASLAGSNAVYVNEAEAQNHRPEATVISVPLMIAKNGGEAVYGLKYADVLDKIGGLKDKLKYDNRGSFVLGLCGKKIESDPGITSKITVARDLIDQMRKGDAIVMGGAVTYTFLLAQHYKEKIESNTKKVNEIVKRHDEMISSETKDVKDKKEAAAITADIQKKKSEELKGLLEVTDEDIKRLIGDSYIRWGQEGEQIVFAYSVIAKAEPKGVEVITALDHTITDKLPDKKGSLPEDAEIKAYENPTGIPEGFLGVGEGPKTLEKIAEAIKNCGIYLQSGPFSIEDERVEEMSKTDKMTFDAARECREKGGVTIAAGGDTVARVNTRKAQDSFSTITSAGGATLELINGKSKGRDAVEEAQRVKGS
ncbi:phosphoglycerate kinase [Candidatus Woesearchaeota archaeon]|nr:phosphoglycerate kinase [Candidatus Woesearchaeota archaeon]